MTDARGRLAELEEDRAARVREQEAAQVRLQDYEAGAGSLAVDGKATDEIAAELERLRDSVAIEKAAVAVLESAITSAKVAVLEARRKECEKLARDAEAERDAHLAKLQTILDGMIELEETAALAILPTGGKPAAKSLILERKAEHWAQQAQRLGSGLPEAPMIFQDD